MGLRMLTKYHCTFSIHRRIKPGRFISWDNKAHQQCVLTSSGGPRRFLGPVVLDAQGTGLIPVVDILAVGISVERCVCVY